MGRPRKQIDWDIVEKLCHMQATQEEICDWFMVSVDTLERDCKRQNKIRFADYFAQKRTGGKVSLRRKQWKKAVENEDTTMLIFLGKQYLGQSDRNDSNMNLTGVTKLDTLLQKLEDEAGATLQRKAG